MLHIMNMNFGKTNRIPYWRKDDGDDRTPVYS